MIITVANPVPGVGKTTMATHLADDLSGDGGGVVLMDTDPRADAVRWTERRLRARRSRRFHIVQPREGNVRKDIRSLGRKAAYVVIDTPSRFSPMTQLALVLADVVLVPWPPNLGASPHRAITLQMIAEARRHRPDLKAMIVLTRLREESAGAVKLGDALPSLAAEIHERPAFSVGRELGQLVREVAPHSTPALEIVRFAQAVRALHR